MMLSSETVETLIDLIQNKLAVLEIGDRDDVREMVVLRHCLAELQGLSDTDVGLLKSCAPIARRGRRRKASALMDEMMVPLEEGMVQHA